MNNNKLRFSFDWKASLLAALLLPCLIALGYWQLDRAAQKTTLKANYDVRKQSAAKDIRTLNSKDNLRYQPIKITGYYLNNYTVLLDNKIFKGRFGYEILNAFAIAESDQVVWVNRGWLAGDSSRRQLPLISPVEGLVTIDAEVYIPHSELLVLGDKQKPILKPGVPLVLSQLDITALGDQIPGQSLGYSVRLKEYTAGVLERNWLVVNIQPAKHTAYAFQWFSMAAMLAIIMFLANTNCWALFKDKKSNKTNH